ncbi:Signal recognition particle protein, partial [Coemansia helicoidea]
MVFHDSWESFEAAAAGLFAAAPDRTRYSLKYRNADAALVLKVTDNATCAQLRTSKLDDIQQIARLHRKLAELASGRAGAVKELPPAFPERESASNSAARVKSGSGVVKKPQPP